MKCNLIVPGFAKCGTSSLHEYLNQHPSICMSITKEPHFFVFEDYFEKGPSEHDRLFEHADKHAKVFGESSTMYCVWEPAMRRIREFKSNIKLVVLVRHPVERLLSHYNWMCAQGKEQLELRDAIKLELESPYDPNVHRRGSYPWYRRHSAYAEFCETMINVFGSPNLLFLKTNELSENLSLTLDKIFRFLDVPTLGELSMEIAEIRANQTSTTHASRYHLFKQSLQKIPLLEPAAKLIPGKRRIQQLLGNYKTKAPKLNESSIRFVGDLLKEDIDYFESL